MARVMVRVSNSKLAPFHHQTTSLTSALLQHPLVQAAVQPALSFTPANPKRSLL